MTVVAVNVLGGFGFVIDDRQVPELNRRDAGRLAKLLVLTPGRRMHREVLVDALWPADPGSSANRLHEVRRLGWRCSRTPT
jgi:DNA-binding SARP family transcriptional activator